jgi:serine/threonine-protein kinase
MTTPGSGISNHDDADMTARLDGTRVGSRLLPPRYCRPVRIARGGMSEVYKATDAELGRTVAVKLLDDGRADDTDLRHRFEREARAAARLSGEAHTITIYDVGIWRDRPFIVMEYLAGGSLDGVIRTRGAQSPALALRRLDEAAGALDHAHAHGVVHRDVKPANLLLDEQGAVHVADFGIATALGVTSMTRTGTVLGTGGYLAPEQAEGKPAGAAADRYSLGIVAFELLTGERPFRRESVTAEAAAHVSAPVPSASSLGVGLPRRVDRVFERALAKKPEERYGSCRELVDALRDALTGGQTATRIAPFPVETAATHRVRRTGLIALGALLLMGAGVLAAELTSGNGGAAAKPPPPSTVTVTVTAPARRQATPATSGSAANAGLQLANADWQLATALAGLGRCNDALPLVDRAQAIVGDQPRFDQLRALCTGPPGHRPGHHGHGHH